MGKLRLFLTFPSLLSFQPKDLQPTKQQKHLVHVNTFTAPGFVREAVRDICYAMLPAHMTCQPQEFFPEVAFFSSLGLCGPLLHAGAAHLLANQSRRALWKQEFKYWCFWK